MNKDSLNRSNLDNLRNRSLVEQILRGKVEHTLEAGFEVEKTMLQVPAIEVGQRMEARICAEM